MLNILLFIKFIIFRNTMYFFYQNIYIHDSFYLSLILFNIIVYIIILFNFFLLLFFFDINYIKSLSELKFLGSLNFLTFYVVLIFLSLAGTPPLAGFVSKFLIFLNIYNKQNYFLFLIFLLLNFFSLYYYLQNLRFLVSNKISEKIICKNNFFKLNFNSVYFLNFLNFLNLFSILYFEDFFIFLNNVCLNINF